MLVTYSTNYDSNDGDVSGVLQESFQSSSGIQNLSILLRS